MRSPLLLCSLFAFAFALTLGRAAIVDKRGENCGYHSGWLQVGTTSSPGSIVAVTGWVQDAATGYAFGQIPVGTTARRAVFHFNGCQSDGNLNNGSNWFNLYCTSCFWSEKAGVAVMGTVFDSSFSRVTEWVFYDWGFSGTVTPNWASSHDFIWDKNGYIYPVTRDRAQVIQPSLNAWYYPGANEITFKENTGAQYYVLKWVEAS